MFDIFKKSNNVDRGTEAEEVAKSYLSWRHQKIRRTGVGSDYEGIDVDPFTGRVEKTKYEVKRNDSQLSDKQRRTHGLRVIRVRDDFMGNPTNISEERKDGSKIDNYGIFGSGSSKPKRSRNNDLGFGSGLDNMFGMGSSSKRSKRSNDFGFGSGLNDMFGTGSSGKRKRNSSDSWGLGF